LGSVIATTDASGVYSVSLYPGIYTINVSKTGYSNWSTNATVASNTITTVPTISLSLNTVTVTANRTVGSADAGQNVSFNLTVVNTGDDATFIVTNVSTNVTNVTTTPPSLLLTTSTSTGYVVVNVNNSYFGGWPVTITISNTSQSKSASVTLNAIMRDSSASFTNVSSSNDTTTTVTGATLVNATVQDYAHVSGNSTSISNATVTGSGTSITDGSVIKGTYVDSNIDNSTIGNATVDSSNLTGSTISGDASVSNSTLTGATVDNSTLDNVTVTRTSSITNVANLANIIIRGVDVTGVPAYDYEGELQGSSSAGSVEYLGINFTRVYTDVRISQLVIEQSSNQNVASNNSTTISDTSLGTSMNFSMIVNLTRGMVINISETGISPDGVALPSGTQLGNFLFIQSNDTNALNVTSNTLRLYFDTDPSTYSGGVAIYYYNTATSAWEKLTTTASGTEGGRYYREAAPNHFSTFALLGTVTTTTSTSSGGSSGSTGGSGVSTSEPYTNIAKSERYDKSLIANVPVTYTFKAPELGIYEIAVTGKESENDIALRVEVLKGASKLVTIQAPGAVYKNVNVWAGTKRIKEALIRFRVENSWLGSNSLAGSDVKMVKWDGSQWTQLETTEKTRDDTYTSYEAKTDTFSVFAITGLKGGVIVPTATPAGEVTETPVKPTGTATAAPTPAPTKKVPGFELVLVAAALCSVYLFSRKRR
ncbi:MAG: PGF-pre-PGF domain-containing protein, partial [Candidatus Methanoperedens sp.]